MPELNREEIIKALECCASPNYICGECPIDQKKKEDCVCGQFVSQEALTLIKLLTEEKREIFEELKKAGIDKYRYPIIADLKKKYIGE